VSVIWRRLVSLLPAALGFGRLIACGTDYSSADPPDGGSALPNGGEAGPIADAVADTTAEVDAGFDAGAPCTVTCDSHHCDDDGGCHPVVFVSNSKTTGSFPDGGGSSGGDAICASEATAASLKGKYVAWLSTSTVDAVTRVTASAGSSRPVWGTGGVQIAKSYVAMTETSLQMGISTTAAGAIVPMTETVWTGTLSNGSSDNNDCSDWTADTSGNGIAGQAGTTSSAWTYVAVQGCSEASRLYCFEIVP
jgi:hypothetical protein